MFRRFVMAGALAMLLAGNNAQAFWPFIKSQPTTMQKLNSMVYATLTNKYVTHGAVLITGLGVGAACGVGVLALKFVEKFRLRF